MPSSWSWPEPSSSSPPPPYMFRLKMISSMVVFAPQGAVAKTLSVLRLATHKPIVYVDAVVGG